jgi:energy-converting hydrogenase Eha subunit A
MKVVVRTIITSVITIQFTPWLILRPARHSQFAPGTIIPAPIIPPGILEEDLLGYPISQVLNMCIVAETYNFRLHIYRYLNNYRKSTGISILL